MADLERALARSVEHLAEAGLRYTRRQLYYELCRALSPRPERRAALAALGLGIIPALALARRPRLAAALGGAGVALAGGLAALARLPRSPRPPLAPAEFAGAFATYSARHGAPPGLLEADQPPPLPLAGREPDLADYGLARALICQDADLARMLVANQLHMELECAILALGAATPLPDHLVAMLMRTPGARVLLLHDASPEGLALARAAPRLLDLPDGLPCEPVGLRPAHAAQLRLFAMRGPAADLVDSPYPLTPRERAWLRAGWRAEVAALPPRRLLRALRRQVRGRAPRPPRPPALGRASGFMSWPTT